MKTIRKARNVGTLTRCAQRIVGVQIGQRRAALRLVFEHNDRRKRIAPQKLHCDAQVSHQPPRRNRVQNAGGRQPIGQSIHRFGMDEHNTGRHQKRAQITCAAKVRHRGPLGGGEGIKAQHL